MRVHLKNEYGREVQVEGHRLEVAVVLSILAGFVGKTLTKEEVQALDGRPVPEPVAPKRQRAPRSRKR